MHIGVANRIGAKGGLQLGHPYRFRATLDFPGGARMSVGLRRSLTVVFCVTPFRQLGSAGSFSGESQFASAQRAENSCCYRTRDWYLRGLPATISNYKNGSLASPESETTRNKITIAAPSIPLIPLRRTSDRYYT